MDVDIDRLIFEIKNRPAIWNTKCREYNDRVEKIKQWEEVINIFTDPFTSIEEKKDEGRMLQKRWRTLRDAFVKQRRELASAESVSAATDKKIYKYYKQLLFLLPVVGTNTTHNSAPSQEDSDSIHMPYNSPHSNNITPPPEKKLKKSDSIEKIGRELVNVLKSKEKNDEDDPDRQFMLSLVSDLKNVPQRLKSKVKMNILKCITDAQDLAEEARKEDHAEGDNCPIVIKNESSP